MAFKKKKWVNVPDPSNPPTIPEGQDALARFDADNMNRIEDGIEEVNAPIYTESTTLTTLTSGENIGVAFGKIKKAIAELISHLANKSNPHGTTAAQVGALPISGGIISGRSVGLADGYGSIASDKNCTTVIAKNLTNSADNSRQIYVANSSYAPKVDDSVFLHDTINGVGKKYYLYGEHHKPTAAEIGALPISGGVISGNLGIRGNYGMIDADKNCAVVITKNLIDDTNTCRKLFLANSSNQGNVKDSIYLQDIISGVATNYKIFGEHNKPTGTYQGDGNSTKEVTVGGIGDLLMVFDTADPNQTMYLVSSQGKVWYSTGSAGNINSHNTKAKYVNGKLILSNQDTTYPQLNRDGITYKYQVL